MTPWWRRDKVAETDRSAARADRAAEPRLDFADYAPSQDETLFDAEEYAASSMPVADPGSASAFVDAIEPTVDPGVGLEEPTEPEPETGPGAAPASARETDTDTADNSDLSAPAADHGHESDPSDSRRSRHVRRRKAGRSRRPADESGETGAAPAPAPVPTASGAVAIGEVPGRTGRVRAVLATAGRRLVAVLVIIAVLAGSIFAVALGVNALARWNARRLAALSAAPASPAEDNLLIIGVSDGVAVGFTALKAERPSKRVLGIAIPDGAFVEVPGQGFERVGASYAGGPEVSKDAVTNYLGVPFNRYVIVEGSTYQTLLKDQNIAALMSQVVKTDLTADQRKSFTDFFASVGTKDVWIVPLPVKPVAVGDQRYFEPQRAQVADLLLQWWGVQPGQQKATPRVIVYNGVGTPGIAGVASQQLIRAGLRVVDSGNADNFDHATTLILLFHGTQADAESVRKALGVGQVVVQSATQELTDMIVIIGADYRPPTSDASTVPTEGVQ